MTLYPLLMAPFFRSGEETPWGGNMLRDAFMKDSPEQTGESLEISALPGRESMVRNGAHVLTYDVNVYDGSGAHVAKCLATGFQTNVPLPR